ncbi:spondin domain-containing protein [Rubrivirga marina]|uniref:Spondin domain-containing protein n=1 Tax=Rubrivirga marina TaxID=1196024 RepID=A0A271J5D6_9BACT|nr:spondin domain-containing protein [Rubrivirga marina]PAP78477.1 hypothetical protein BSZ37_19625 [Rubrivirga marina]
MRPIALLLLFVSLVGCDGLFSENDDELGEVERGEARYLVTFDATWSAESHPDMFPASAHFSTLTGAAHVGGLSLWEVGGTATDGIRSMAETGATDLLRGEVAGLGTDAAYVEGGYVGVSPGAATVEVTVSDDRPHLSVVSMLAPSPDWFVGVNGLDLRTNDGWIDRTTVDLVVYDAGTDDGVTYTAENAARAVRAPIAEVAYAPLTGTTVGTFIVERIEEDGSAGN